MLSSFLKIKKGIIGARSFFKGFQRGAAEDDARFEALYADGSSSDMPDMMMYRKLQTSTMTMDNLNRHLKTSNVQTFSVLRKCAPCNVWPDEQDSPACSDVSDWSDQADST
jgi:hypothetical protein